MSDDKGLKEDAKTNKITHVSKLTRQTVEKMVGEAFEYCDTNKDGLLSQKQFTAWVKQNPGALQLLETVFAKHIWSGWGAEEHSNLSASPGKGGGGADSILTATETGTADSDGEYKEEKGGSPRMGLTNRTSHNGKSMHGQFPNSRSSLIPQPGPLSPGMFIFHFHFHFYSVYVPFP